MSAIREAQASLAFAEREREEAYAVWRAAHRAYFDADMRTLHARLDLEDALADAARPIERHDHD
ncbi:hypothetical protein J7E45_01320 [Microbacterium sp. ISL-59]|uniref:hypothetical protein n=1 Tax=Microbacterium sp. ISL-59 TaxID=2819159 RepID=UPI001BE8BB0E|nr:hypothetical protein [Microbacterium sp. ISL-59]MBT2494235.1 hypothetical protein [Microbacterium sp. ISL-59]